MKVDKIWVAGLILALLAIGLSVSIATNFAFPTFRYASPSDHLIDVNEDIGQQDSEFMWTNRTLDLMAQAIVIFSAAAACLVMLRVDKTERVKK